MTPLLGIFALCAAIDGDTLRCGDERVRLARIDTPERCGVGFEQAKQAMQWLINGKEARCVLRKREKYGRLLAECSTRDTPSLSDAMLANGSAEPYRRKRGPTKANRRRTPKRRGQFHFNRLFGEHVHHLLDRIGPVLADQRLDRPREFHRA